MIRDEEALGGAGARQPAAEAAVGQLHDAVAFGANEVVVMARAAEAVTGLCPVGKGVDHARSGEVMESPINSCKTDWFGANRQPPMDGLSRRIVRLAGKLIQNGNPPAGGTQARRAQVPVDPLQGAVASLCHAPVY